MATRRAAAVLIGITCVLLALGGCIFTDLRPDGDPGVIDLGGPQNLLQNPNADAGMDSWTPFSADAFVEGGSGNPAFTIRNGSFMTQRVDITGKTSRILVIVGITAAQNATPLSLGRMHAYTYSNADPNMVIAHFTSPDLVSTSSTSNEWVILTAQFALPPNADAIELFLATGGSGAHDGSHTWFDYLGLYLADTTQLAQDIIDDYTTTHTW